jgi:hypothetical protein
MSLFAHLIRDARRPGLNRQQDIAKIYGVSQRTVSLIVRGESWKEGAGK